MPTDAYALLTRERSIRAQVVAVLLALALALTMLVSATPAEAHISSYCGHQNRTETADGAWWLVEFWSSENVTHDGRQVHFHYYIHYYWNGAWGWVASHSQKRHCGGWH